MPKRPLAARGGSQRDGGGQGQRPRREPSGTGHTRARSHTATDRLAGDGHRVSPPPDGRGERGWTATRHGGPAPWGEAEPGGEGTPPPHRPDRPDPKADGRPPLGVFKPPRRDALGTWREGGGRGGAGRGESAAPRRPQRPPALTTGNELRPSRGPPSERGSYVALTARDAGATRPPADHRPHRKAAPPPPPPRAGREGPGQAAAGSEQWSGGMEDQRPGENPAQSRRREGKAHPETRRKHHGAAKAARPETETRGGHGDYHRKLIGQTFEWVVAATEGVRSARARTDDGPPDNSTEGTSGAGPHRGVAEGRGGKPQAPPPPPHPRHGPPPRRPGAPSSHVGTGRHARALARADRRGVATRAKAQGPRPLPPPTHPPTQERHGYDGRPAAASRVPTRAQGDTREAHHPGTPARPRRPGGDTHTRGETAADNPGRENA
ncbi:basic salivary proline-rich protein 4-like [Sus scrofa]|uniref:basic salivary proline-rich protein 4-like n=1 Tax=Sus scrofa TaxID=9823 RepID=UPI000A2B4D7E|nr:basic salivary proline-rich protein 4-like [Sus scrofa]